jgi:hypothetical protein
VCNKIINAEFKGDKYFVDEVETQLREKTLRSSQTLDIHYSEEKSSYKAIALTYLKGSSIESFTLGLLPKIDFTADQTTHWQQLES